MALETERLLIGSVGQDDDPDEFVPIFNSNPDYLEASDGKRVFDRVDIERYLYAESSRENGRCLAIRLRETGVLVGAIALLVPHPGGYPWIGLLILDSAYQRRGLGRETAAAIENELRREGWNELRLGVLMSNERAFPFWDAVGFSVVETRNDTGGRPCWVLKKNLDSGDQLA